ncbi:hypothetical protein V498_05150 [Pseudogymnoascus sp. VKM F-4517 (FW-2822)]|nr:hypothetical protein V498_05150 [Pseudogymnoascus sp. VKM F-4517 (FW-2822)]
MDRLEQEVLGYRNKPTVDNIYDNALIFHLIPNFAAHRHTGNRLEEKEKPVAKRPRRQPRKRLIKKVDEEEEGEEEILSDTSSSECKGGVIACSLAAIALSKGYGTYEAAIPPRLGPQRSYDHQTQANNVQDQRITQQHDWHLQGKETRPSALLVILRLMEGFKQDCVAIALDREAEEERAVPSRGDAPVSGAEG